MSDLLSNEEIESLMQMVNSEASEFDSPVMIEGFDVGPSGLGAGGLAATVSPIDLLTPNRISRAQLDRIAHVLHGTAEAIGTVMSDQLRCEIHCDCVAVDQTRFASWAPIAAEGAVVYVLAAPPLDIPLVLSVSRCLLYGWADRVLGGRGMVERVPEEFTETELSVIDGFLAPVFDAIESTLSEIVDVRIGIEDRFTNPARINLLPGQDTVLSAHFQTGSELFVGDIRIGLAHSSIEPWLRSIGKATERYKHEPGESRRELTPKVKPVGLQFSVELGSAKLSLRDLMSLRVGDVVRLDRRVAEPLVAPVEGVPKFTGQVGTLGSRLGFQVASVLE